VTQSHRLTACRTSKTAPSEPLVIGDDVYSSLSSLQLVIPVTCATYQSSSLVLRAS
jgi:hypothetical protein